jgi:DNA-binding winged helix-turn-helix (wHTH) protein
MPAASEIQFGVYRLDPRDERLWRGPDHVRLTHKALAVLRHLAARPGQLVTKAELLEAVWPGVVVVEAVLTTAIRELRRALDDRPGTPRYIETVHRRGYRFIAPVAAAAAAGRAPLVGREPEWALLHERYRRAEGGARQIVLVAGEAGIGKTALVDAFVADVAAGGDALVAHGQCIAHYGTGEAYLPLLDALGRLTRGPDGGQVTELLRAAAPSWLPHLPALAAGAGAAAATPARMLRELAEALDRLAEARPLLLVLEDLHWSDAATLDWIAFVARRRDPARLLLLGTYRPVDAIVGEHPLPAAVSELAKLPRFTELPLDHLGGDDVQAFLAGRFAGLPELPRLGALLRQRTSGLPLFLVATADALVREGLVERDGDGWRLRGGLDRVGRLVPASARRFIDRQIDRLAAEDQALLEAAAAAGETFSVPALAAAAALDEEEVEARCARWAARGQFLAAAGAERWPDGTMAARYRFTHALFRDVIERRTSAGRRARLHRRLGDRLAAAHGADTTAIAPELALHYDQGGDARAALRFLEEAAARATQRSGYVEALAHVDRALELVEEWPESRERAERQIALQLARGTALSATRGWSAAEAERAYVVAGELCARIGDQRRRGDALWGLIIVSVVRCELERTRALSAELLALAERQDDRLFELVAHMELAGAAFGHGELALAREHFEAAEARYRPEEHRVHLARLGADYGVFNRAWSAHLLWRLGLPAGLERSEAAVELARRLGHPFTLAIALAYAAVLRQLAGDGANLRRLAAEAHELCAQHGFAYYLTWARILHGWSEGRVDEIAGGIAALEAQSVGRALPYFYGLLGDAELRRGAHGAARRALAAGLAHARRSGEQSFLPELRRLEDQLTAIGPPPARARPRC